MPQTPTVADLLLSWWDQHGRHDLPWQQNPTAYRVWVSEIMLQQTQVPTVERYYDRFMQTFPDVQSLAAADDDAVLHLWSGLGYYSRARNLHKAAIQIVAEHAGELPTDYDALVALPGIGRSTAGAILSLAHDQYHAILDGNAKRVLARLFAVEGWTGSTANLKILWQHAERCTPKERTANYTQAIMDLGATLCTRSKPKCEACPLQTKCLAFAQNVVGQIPAPKPKKAKPRKATTLVMVVNEGGELLLEKRPPSGIWGGLWSFPELDSVDAVDDWCVQQFGSSPAAQREWPTVSHSFSHYDLDMAPVEIRLPHTSPAVMEADRWLWYNTRSPASVGLAAPVAKILATVTGDGE